MRDLAAILVCACSIAAGCRDATDVCDLPHACEVPGWDLAIVAAVLDNAIANDTATGLPLAPRDLRVRFTVRNRGSSLSGSSRAALGWNGNDWVEAQAVTDTVWIAPLEPGDSMVKTAMLKILTPYLTYSNEPVNVRVSIIAGEGVLDEHPENDTLATPPMQLPLAFLQLAVEPIGVPRLQVNEPFWVRYRVWNAGYYEPLVGVSGVVCLWASGDGCFPGNFAVFGRRELPTIAPGDTVTVAYTTAVAPTAAWQDEAWQYWYSVCPQPSSWTDPYLDFHHAGDCVSPLNPDDAWVRVRPDYDGVCAPPTLVAGESIVLRYNCGFMPYSSQDPGDRMKRVIDYLRFHLTALNAIAGVTYVVQPGPSYIRDAQGERAVNLARGDSLRFAVSGRYYLESFGKDTLTFTMKQLPATPLKLRPDTPRPRASPPQ